MQQKVCLYVKLIFSVFIFPLIISTIQIKSWQSHQINEILPRKFCGIPAKLLRKKNKTSLGFEGGAKRAVDTRTLKHTPEALMHSSDVLR